MTAELDFPPQKVFTKPRLQSNLKWVDDKNLIFDLSSRSMELKFALYTVADGNKESAYVENGL